MERKSVRDFVMEDMWNDNLMVGNEVKGCVTGEGFPTNEKKEEFCQGIFATFPHMMLAHFVGWMWPDGEPKPYQAFMDQSIPQLQEKVFPELKAYFFNEDLNPGEKAQIMAVLLTRVIPQHVFTGFYEYMFAGSEDYKDISGFWAEVAPLLEMTAELIRTSYTLSAEARAEAFLYAGCRYPFLMIKRWYDWQFGKDKLEMGPPPEGFEDGPPPM